MAQRGRKSNEYKKGYQEAIEAIRKKIEQSGKDPSSANPDDVDTDDLQRPGNGGGEGNPNNSMTSGNGSSQTGSSSTGRDADSSGSVGRVRQSDCESSASNDLQKIPDIAGGMMSKSTGDKIAKEEGAEETPGSQQDVNDKWKKQALDAAQKAANNSANQGKGKGAGLTELANKIISLTKPAKDWKKELKQIVGRSISSEDFRRGYTNNPVLVSQGRISLTDKAKYDNLDCIMAWIDTSGSMSQKFMDQALFEVYNIACAKKPMKIIVVQFDDKIQEVREYTTLQTFKRDLPKIKIKGHGGTDYSHCFDMLKRDPKYNRLRPELIVCFTDGYLDQIKRDPRRMGTFLYVIMDNPTWNVQYKDQFTKVIYIDQESMSK